MLRYYRSSISSPIVWVGWTTSKIALLRTAYGLGDRKGSNLKQPKKQGRCKGIR